MAPAQSKMNYMKANREETRRLLLQVPPAIPLLEPPEAKPNAEDLIKFECKNLDGTKAKYNITITRFGSGEPEALLKFLEKLSAIFQGQEIFEGPARHAVMKTLLKGEALDIFSQKSEELGAKTLVHFGKCVNALKEHVFPFKALSYQKRYMRELVRKPAGMSMKQLVTRLKTINNLLP